MKMKNTLCKVIMCFIVLSFFGCSKKNIEETVEKNEKVQTGSGIFWECGMEDEGNNFYVIAPDFFLNLETIPSRYAVSASYQYRWKTLGEIEDRYIFQSTVDYFTLDIYSIQSSEKIKTIDAKVLLEKNYPGWQFFVSRFFTRPYRGKPCIGVYVEKNAEIDGDISVEKLQQALSEVKASRKLALIDIETDHVYLEDYSEEQFYADAKKITPMQKRMNVLSDEYVEESSGHSGIDLWEINEIDGGSGVLKYFDGTYEVMLSVTSLPERNERLYSMFPKLKEQVKAVMEKKWRQGDEIPKICITLTDNPTPEDVMRLILNDDQEITFEGAVLSKQYSIDNEPHEIRSFEEYYQYRKPYEYELDATEIGPIFPAD